MPSIEHKGRDESGPYTLGLFSEAVPHSISQVSYEYIACQQARQGVMILSEFAGAAQSLNGSIVINPWDSQQVADAIHEAVTMDAGVRAENHRKLFKYVNKYSASFWGSSFIKEMGRIKFEDDAETVQKIEDGVIRDGLITPNGNGA